MAGMLFVSAILLLYTAVVAPAQIFMWDYTNTCEYFPTLYLDLLVDSFFLVTIPNTFPLLHESDLVSGACVMLLRYYNVASIVVLLAKIDPEIDADFEDAV